MGCAVQLHVLFEIVLRIQKSGPLLVLTRTEGSLMTFCVQALPGSDAACHRALLCATQLCTVPPVDSRGRASFKDQHGFRALAPGSTVAGG